MEAHQHEHTGQHPYACDVCKKTFRYKSSMNRHQLTHSGQRLYACDVCSKTFSWKSSLKEHQLTHSAQHPFACDVCSKTFSRKSGVKEHQLTHSGQRPYACDVCSKTFSRKSCKKEHQLTHSGQHQYTCDVCNKIFRHMCNRTHQLTHICIQCSMSIYLWSMQYIRWYVLFADISNTHSTVHVAVMCVMKLLVCRLTLSHTPMAASRAASLGLLHTHTAACSAETSMPFACNSSFLSVDGMICHIPFSRRKNALPIAILQQFDCLDCYCRNGPSKHMMLSPTQQTLV
jgi:uncharacterized Zn-finger protein